MQKNNTIIIGISGASGSGKTYISKKIYTELVEEYPELKIGMITEDCYYRDQSHLDLILRNSINYDHPDSIEHSLLLEHLTQLKNNNPIKIPVYDYKVHNRDQNKTIPFEPCDIIIIEGVLLLTNEQIRKMLDLSIFIDTPLDICFIRRLLRDIQERGRSLDSIVNQYYSTVRPMFIQFVEPNKKLAEIIYDNLTDNHESVQLLKKEIMDLFYNKNQ